MSEEKPAEEKSQEKRIPGYALMKWRKACREARDAKCAILDAQEAAQRYLVAARDKYVKAEQERVSLGLALQMSVGIPLHATVDIDEDTGEVKELAQ